MAERGGQPGNNNAGKNKPWRDAIDRALKKRSRVDTKEALDELAEKFLESVDDRESWAFKELGDRLDGKPAQAIVGGDEDDNPVKLEGTIRFVGKPE